MPSFTYLSAYLESLGFSLRDLQEVLDQLAGKPPAELVLADKASREGIEAVVREPEFRRRVSAALVTAGDDIAGLRRELEGLGRRVRQLEERWAGRRPCGPRGRHLGGGFGKRG